MTQMGLATLIGQILTEIDTRLADPAFPTSDPSWQNLFALRKHLDDQQRILIQRTIGEEDPQYAALTSSISDANAELQNVINDFNRINTVIKDVTAIAGLVDQVLKEIP
jgi:hypothetical protein